MGIVIFIIGLALAIFAHPRVNRFFMHRFFNEGILTPKRVEPEKAEIVKGTGPAFGIFSIGVVLMILGVLLSR